MPTENNGHTRVNGARKQSLGLADRLLSAGRLSEAQLDLALLEQKRSGQSLGQVLVQLGFVSANTLADYLAERTETRSININCTSIDQAALRLVSLEVARRLRVMPISKGESSLTVAMANPFDVVAIDALQVCGRCCGRIRTSFWWEKRGTPRRRS